ncbi:MAG TPA: signal peptidase I [Patescibacteria group bacterium]|nr:signal peptidase I [Patescibacteria group bacterium]
MDIYSSDKGKKSPKTNEKKLGLPIFYLWLALIAANIIFTLGMATGGAVYATQTQKNIITFLTNAAIILTPIWIFLLGGKLIKILIGIPAAIIAFLLLVYLLILSPHKAVGRSMESNFVAGDYMLGEKVSYVFRSPKRGDVVIFTSSNNQDFFARIVGLPGERLAIRNGRVYINDEVLEEPYLPAGVKTLVVYNVSENPVISETNVLIPKGSYVVMGDNRKNSSDSREYGFIKRSSIQKRIFYIYWPKDRAGPVLY